MKKKIFAVALAATMVAGSTMSAFAEGISGDLTVDAFFSAKTDAVEVADGQTVTFTFNNKSVGTQNWENFVMAVTGATGDAYTGAEQEIAVFRADAWGWGGGMSSFDDPNNGGGKETPFVFDTDANFDNWVADMTAGVACTVNFTKSGNTITYDAKVGNYYVKTTATSTVDLPSTVYVFFTGEKCELTGFNTSFAGAETPAETPSEEAPAETEAAPAETDAAPAPAPAETQAAAPQTGDATNVAIFALAAVAACGAVVATRKKVTE